MKLKRTYELLQTFIMRIGIHLGIVPSRSVAWKSVPLHCAARDLVPRLGTKRSLYTFSYFICLLFLWTSLVWTAPDKLKPVTRDASKEAIELLKFFYDITGKYVLTGQHNFPNVKFRNSEFYTRYVGKTPVIYSTDMGFAEDGDTDSYLARPDIVQNAIRHHQAGGLITLCWHAVPPTADEPITFQPLPGSEPSGKLASVQGQLTYEQFKDVLTPGTELHKKWCDQVDAIALFLKQLDEAKVPVLWRPYHEMNGSWFWWGGRLGEFSTKKLYIQMFNRLVKHHKIKNLIWVWNVDRPNRPEMKFSNFYPGDDYVDIVSLDVYGGDFNQVYYDSLNVLAKGKPMVLGEVGNPPGPEILDAQPRWSYWVIWAGMVRNTLREDHLQLLNDPRLLVMEKPSFWDVTGWYHKTCGLSVSRDQWTKPADLGLADFSGTWVFNENRSKLNRTGTGFIPYKIEITQNDSVLILVKTMLVEWANETITEETFRLDGTESRSDAGFRDAKRVSTTSWSETRDTLTIRSETWFGQGDRMMKMQTTEIWTIQDKGRAISIQQSSVSPRGRQEITMIYDRACVELYQER